MPIAHTQHALTATQIIANIAKLSNWRLSGDGATLAIEKVFLFADYYQTMAFVNAVAFVAHAQNHHPELIVNHNSCVVRLRTHDASGITLADFACATQVDALLPETAPV